MSKKIPTTAQRSWAEVVLAALRSSPQAVPLSYLYGYVETQAPKLLEHNHTYKATIRRVVQGLRDQGLAENVSKGVWKAITTKVGDGAN